MENEEWRNLVKTMDATVEDLHVLINTAYQPEAYISDRIEFFYVTKIGESGNSKKIVLEDDTIYKNKTMRTHDDRAILPRHVTISDISIQVRNKVGDEVQDDCTCNSEYMIGAMKRVGESIRRAYHWILLENPCYLIMDNAGGIMLSLYIKFLAHHSRMFWT